MWIFINFGILLVWKSKFFFVTSYQRKSERKTTCFSFVHCVHLNPWKNAKNSFLFRFVVAGSMCNNFTSKWRNKTLVHFDVFVQTRVQRQEKTESKSQIEQNQTMWWNFKKRKKNSFQNNNMIRFFRVATSKCACVCVVVHKLINQ